MSELAFEKRTKKMIKTINAQDIVTITYEDKTVPDAIPTLGFRKSN